MKVYISKGVAVVITFISNLLCVLLVAAPELLAKNAKMPKKAEVKLPIPMILGEVSFNKKSISTFQFEYNNCDGGSWETVVFQNKDGILVFVSFNTPSIAGAKAKQVAITGLTSDGSFIRGIDGTFDFANTTRDKTGVIKRTFKGSLILDTEIHDQKSGAVRMTSVKEPINIEGLPFSRSRPFSYDLMLSDLRSIPKLEKATLKKMCKES